MKYGGKILEGVEKAAQVFTIYGNITHVNKMTELEKQAIRNADHENEQLCDIKREELADRKRHHGNMMDVARDGLRYECERADRELAIEQEHFDAMRVLERRQMDQDDVKHEMTIGLELMKIEEERDYNRKKVENRYFKCKVTVENAEKDRLAKVRSAKDMEEVEIRMRKEVLQSTIALIDDETKSELDDIELNALMDVGAKVKKLVGTSSNAVMSALANGSKCSKEDMDFMKEMVLNMHDLDQNLSKIASSAISKRFAGNR